MPTPSQNDKLIEVIDHLTAARRSAEDAGEKFLAYLLSMALQEARTAVRSHAATHPPFTTLRQ